MLERQMLGVGRGEAEGQGEDSWACCRRGFAVDAVAPVAVMGDEIAAGR